MTLKEYTNNLKGKKVSVIGIGVSNIPLIRHLLNSGISVTACDKREEDSIGPVVEEFRKLGCSFNLGDRYLDNIDADIIFRTPGIHPDTPQLATAVAKGAVLTSEMEAFFQVCPCKIISVTGSDGKTTTTTLIAQILKAEGYNVHVGGNIGTPLLCDADSFSGNDICVLELSSFQLMTMRQSAQTVVVTNVSPNHLDVHKSMDEYVNAKMNSFLYQDRSGTVILNLDNTITAGFSSSANGNIRFFSRKKTVNNGACLIDGQLCEAVDGVLTPVVAQSEILLPGLHNVENYLAAICAVHGLVSKESIARVARNFGGVEHRMEFVRELHGVKYYNDSIASSPTRTIAGLNSFNQKIILIAGGKDKGVPFTALAPEIIEHVKLLVLTGMTADAIKKALIEDPDYNGEPEIIKIDDFQDAVLKASQSAVSGDIVVLSPACTSFDRFKNFAERGLFFKEIINNLN